MPVITITPQLRTIDLERSICFYREKGGLELEDRHADFYAGIRSSRGSFHLKLVDAPDPSNAFVHGGGHLHPYLGVDDVDAFAERLRAS
jgi:catechol 2,3-dioxygenase-like lactoylglutathione lyase family enzyme